MSRKKLTILGSPIYKLYQSSTVDENIIATIKMRNNFCDTLKMVCIVKNIRQVENFLTSGNEILVLMTNLKNI